MKVALVHDWLNGMRGGEKVLEYFCSAFPDAHIFTLHSELEKISSLIKNHKIHHSFIQKLPGKTKFYRYYLPLFPLAVSQFDFSDYDFVISTSHCAVKNISVPSSIPHLCYCFSPMRYLWVLQNDYFGDGIKRKLIQPLVNFLKKWDFEGAKRVTRFISISKTIQSRIQKCYGRESTVIYPPTELKFDPCCDKSDYFLILSALTPYKRIDLALKACDQLGIPLKVAGTGPLINDLRKIAGKKTEFLGWVSDSDKISLLKHAQALLFPGFEDFGIVPLEAMAYATPVIGFNQGGLTETVIHEQTGILFDQQTVESLKNAILQLKKKTWTKKAFQSALNRFSIEEFTRAIHLIVQSMKNYS